MCGGHLHPHRGRHRHRAHGCSKNMCGLHARTQDLIPVIRRLDAIDGSTHEVNDPRGTLEFALPSAKRARIPGCVAPRTSYTRRLPRDDDDRCALGGKMCCKRDAKEPAAASDDDSLICRGHEGSVMEAQILASPIPCSMRYCIRQA